GVAAGKDASEDAPAVLPGNAPPAVLDADDRHALLDSDPEPDPGRMVRTPVGKRVVDQVVQDTGHVLRVSADHQWLLWELDHQIAPQQLDPWRRPTCRFLDSVAEIRPQRTRRQPPRPQA